MNPTNQQIAEQFLTLCFTGDIDAAMLLLAPDGSWWTLGDPQKISVAGERSAQDVGHFLKKVHRGFPNGMQVRFDGITAEADRVAIEATSQAQLPDGRTYTNRYHFLLEVRDGRVQRVREYVDTHYIHELQLQAATRTR